MFSRNVVSACLLVAAANCASPPPPAPAPTPVASVDLPPAEVQTTSSADQPLQSDTGGADAASDAPAPDAAAPADQSCKTDADCVPAQCCHATACVSKEGAPDCSKTMCTKECRGGTMDCGGGCHCQQGKCAAKLGRP
jgi:hypothetical protein